MISCDSNRHNAIVPGMTVQKNGTGQHSLGNLDKVTDPNKLVGWLTNFKDIEAEHIGFTGTKSTSYPIYKRLCAIATDTMLIRLTTHMNPNIRVYAIWALKERNESLAAIQFQKLGNDTTTVTYYSGDVGMTTSVADLLSSSFQKQSGQTKYDKSKK